MDCSLPGSSIHGIFQARVREWGANKPLSCMLLVFSFWSQQITHRLHISFLLPLLYPKGTIYMAAMLCYAKSLQLCPTLCDPIDGSLPRSPVPGILQARTLEWVAISFSNAWKWKVKVKSLSCVRLFATPWTAANQGPPSMGFSRQEYWSGVPLPSPKLSLKMQFLLYHSFI